MADAASNEKRILIVEDEAVIRNICRTVLGAEGFDVHVTADCHAAQEMINIYHYDLYLIDILIPEMSGKQLYQWLLEKHPLLAKKGCFLYWIGDGRKYQEIPGAKWPSSTTKTFLA